MINDECYFTSNHCDHVETSFLLNRFAISQKLFKSIITLYLSFSKRSLTFHFSINIQKYQILQKRSFLIFFKIISSRSTIENSNDENQSSEKFLNSNSRYAIEKIDKKYSSNKLFKKERKIKIIHETQKSSLFRVLMRKSNIIKKHIWRTE